MAELPRDPPAPAGDLAADLAGFTSLGACIAQRAPVDPVLRDALDAVGYDTFVRDACRVLDAAKAHDAQRCQAIDASSLRERCRATAAMVNGIPDACPWLNADRPALGRDALCVAVASRDARLCVAVPAVHSDGLTTTQACEALVLGNARRCPDADAGAVATACRRDVARWHGVLTTKLEGSTPHDPQPLDGMGTLHVGRPGSPGVEPLAIPLDVAHGVVLVSDGRGYARVDLTQETGGRAAGPAVAVRLRFAFRGPDERTERVDGGGRAADPGGPPLDLHGPTSHEPSAAALESIDLGLPGGYAADAPACTVDVVRAEVRRGGAIQLALDGTTEAGVHGYKLDATIVTFVRDVVIDPRAAGPTKPAPSSVRGPQGPTSSALRASPVHVEGSARTATGAPTPP